MTYEESYMKCKTIEELKTELETDITIAKQFESTDRIKVMLESARKVANIKFKDGLNVKDKRTELI